LVFLCYNTENHLFIFMAQKEVYRRDVLMPLLIIFLFGMVAFVTVLTLNVRNQQRIMELESLVAGLDGEIVEEMVEDGELSTDVVEAE